MTARVLRRVRLNRSIAVNWPFRCNIAARSLISWQLPPAPVIFQKGPNDTNSIYVYRVRRARSRGLIIFHHPTKCVRSKPPRDLCSSSFVRRERNRFEVGTIRERGDEATPPFCSLSSFFPSFETHFLSPYSHHLFLSCFQRIYMYIYTHTHTLFDNSLADDTTRQAPRSATDQYAFTIAAWNDNYCYTRDNSRRCPSVGIRVYCARQPSGERDLQRERERERERGSKLYIGMVYNNGALYFINVDVLTRRWPRLSMSRRSNFADVISRQVTLNPQVRFRALGPPIFLLKF